MRDSPSSDAMPSTAPQVSVIIPVWNAAETLGVQLEALANQVGAPVFEVIIADNGSTDISRAVASSYTGSLRLRIVDASARRGPSYARNTGAEAAASEVLLFCDADDRVAATWVGAMYQALSHHRIVTGPVVYGDAASIAAEPPHLSSGVPTGPRRWLDQVPFGMSGNFGIRADLMRDLGGFDLALRCSEDADLSIRASMNGGTLAWVQDAVVFSARRGTMAGAARQFFRYGYYDAMLYRKVRRHMRTQRPWPLVLRRYLVLALTPYRLLTRRRRWSWIVNVSQCAGRLVGSVRFRSFCP